MKKISIVIVNWNSSKYLKNCLDSIHSYTLNYDIEIIVLDNASYDGSDEVVASYPQNIKFIQLEKNVGFAKANNIGFANTCSEYCLFLNPDTIIKQNVFQVLVDVAENNAKIGAIGCQLLNEDDSLQTSSIQSFPTITNQFINSNFIVNRSKLYKIQESMLGAPLEVDMISGACMFVVSDIFRKVGMFSTDYFMYGEDLDLCYKIKREGYRILFTNKVCVTHFGGKCSSKRSTYYGSVLMRESVYLFMKKFNGRFYSIGYRMGIAVSSFFRCIIILPALALRWRNYKYVFEKWFRIFRWSLGLETWVKKLSHSEDSI